MPSPGNARKPSTKQAPENKADLGQKLSRRRSQDFASKILGWNETGAGVLPKQNTVDVVEKPTAGKQAKKDKGKDKEDVKRIELEKEKGGEEEDEEDEEEEQGEEANNDEDVVEVILDEESINSKDTIAEQQNDLPVNLTAIPKTQIVTPELGGKPLDNTKKAGREVNLKRGAWVRRKSKPQVELATDVKHAGAPKKRIVSDGHWRRDRPPKEDKEDATPDKEKSVTPKPVTLRRSVVSASERAPPSSIYLTEPSSEPVKIKSFRHVRSTSRARSEENRDASPDYETNGTKVYIKQRRRSRQINDSRSENADPRTSGSSLTAPSSTDRPSSATDITPPSPLAVRKIPSTPLSEARQNLRKTLSGEETSLSKSAKQPSNSEDASRRRPSTRKRSKTTENPIQLDTAAMPGKVFGNRIEGWLAATSDPFTERTDKSLEPAPLHISKVRSQRSTESEDDRRYPMESRRRSLRNRRDQDRLDDRATNSTRTSADGYSDTSPSSTPTLRRRGARRDSQSPVKSRRSRDVTLNAAEHLMSGALPGSDGANHRKDRMRTLIPSGTTSRSESHQRHPRPPSDLSENHTIVPDGSTLSRASDGDAPRRNGSGLKRRLTKHSDLMSVLSMSRDDSHPVIAGRSLRARRPAGEPATIGELMNEFSGEELKYQRELRTLVDGVIPVLLQNALAEPPSSPGSNASPRSTGDQAATKPIVDMGIVLERLKTAHKRVPLHEPADLLNWAEGAARVYSDYLKTWRLGFRNVMVNLLPAQDSAENSASRDRRLARNGDRDNNGSEAQQVDVAYLLKRPLVRLKYLTKAFKGIDHFQPTAKSAQAAMLYHDLVQEAKKRVNDENARLEDEAAAGIDPTRARDPRSLAPITGVTIDPTRCVRARDYFDMELNHSSGQQLGCKIELVYRDDAPERGSAGDILFCEVSMGGRWLLFPPLPQSLVSARKGDQPNELVIMIRGFLANARQWREFMLLQTEDESSCEEWLRMLGSSPMPPRLSKRSGFNMLKAADSADRSNGGLSPGTQSSPDKSREPSPREIEVPIGEAAKSSSRIWDASEVNSVSGDMTQAGVRNTRAARYRDIPSSPAARNQAVHAYSDNERQPRYAYEEPLAERPSSRRPVTAHTRSKSDWTASSVSQSTNDYSVWLPSSERMSDESSEEEEKPAKRPSMRRRTSSVPSLDMPTIPKLRKSDRASSSIGPSEGLTERADHRSKEAPTVQQRHPHSGSSSKPDGRSERTSQPQSSARPTSIGLRTGALPSFTPAFLKKHRRSSSPLKHEYEPSTASDSLSDSDISAIDDAESVTSESTADEAEAEAEGVSTVGDLKAFQNYTNRPYSQPQQAQRKQARTSPPLSLPSASLAPSESASQGPYRTVPPTTAEPARTIAAIFCWSERGTWDSLHPEECIIFVTPGLIEAFDVMQTHSVSLDGDDGQIRTPTSVGIKPLVALELTPLVPLRRGTALDITVRSPPSVNSLIRTGNNVMFRSRSPEDCEKLYALINRARIDNPTYIALQNARGPVQQSNWGEVMDQRNAARSVSAPWWHLGSRKSSTYRSKGSRTLSIAATESSIGTMNSAFSALRLFSGGNRIFNIGKSTITSREGTRSTNSESLSSGTATPLPIDPRLGTPLGITNAKIRLYIRESSSKWRDMGPARLTVMLPPRQDPIEAANPQAAGLQKRILIHGKNHGETLLDALLGESSFERVARTGIAVSVWEEMIGPNGETGRVGPVGGVLNARARVYMVQMKSERDAAYTFGLVGKLRY